MIPGGSLKSLPIWYFLKFFLLCKSFDLKRERLTLQVFILMLAI